MRRLHGGDDVERGEAREIGGGDDLRVFDAIAAVARAVGFCDGFKCVESDACWRGRRWRGKLSWKPALSRSMAICFSLAGSMVMMPLVDGSSEYGAAIAAVREPSAPSVTIFSAPVFNIGSVVPPSLRMFVANLRARW